ncbi:hypothetical protein MKZ38_004115 [Zalerion maritima]|uniref:Uncharacterized protein n=1 Tax=Zalerion maritima TaxID=339359 RepID=A0AAD5RM10_9PEZI|nr:hypothetical protein MKZ38_004115 [Zalerion maritima]
MKGPQQISRITFHLPYSPPEPPSSAATLRQGQQNQKRKRHIPSPPPSSPPTDISLSLSMASPGSTTPAKKPTTPAYSSNRKHAAAAIRLGGQAQPDDDKKDDDNQSITSSTTSNWTEDSASRVRRLSPRKRKQELPTLVGGTIHFKDLEYANVSIDAQTFLNQSSRHSLVSVPSAGRDCTHSRDRQAPFKLATRGAAVEPQRPSQASLVHLPSIDVFEDEYDTTDDGAARRDLLSLSLCTSARPHTQLLVGKTGHMVDFAITLPNSGLAARALSTLE